MSNLKKLGSYQFYFSWQMLLLYGLQLFPNIIWILVPVENNILANNESMNPLIDLLEHTLGVAIVITLVFMKNCNEIQMANQRRYWVIAGASLISYYLSWIAYYNGVRSEFLFFLLAFLPPIYFLSISLWKRHYILLIITILFAIIHMGITWHNLIGGNLI